MPDGPTIDYLDECILKDTAYDLETAEECRKELEQAAKSGYRFRK